MKICFTFVWTHREDFLLFFVSIINWIHFGFRVSLWALGLIQKTPAHVRIRYLLNNRFQFDAFKLKSKQSPRWAYIMIISFLEVCKSSQTQHVMTEWIGSSCCFDSVEKLSNKTKIYASNQLGAARNSLSQISRRHINIFKTSRLVRQIQKKTLMHASIKNTPTTHRKLQIGWSYPTVKLGFLHYVISAFGFDRAIFSYWKFNRYILSHCSFHNFITQIIFLQMHQVKNCVRA